MTARQFKARLFVLTVSLAALSGCGEDVTPIESKQPTLGAAVSQIQHIQTSDLDPLIIDALSINASVVSTPSEPEAPKIPTTTQPEAPTTSPTDKPPATTPDPFDELLKPETEQPDSTTPDSPSENHTQSRVNTIGSSVGDVVKLVDQLPVSTSQLSTQMTPIDNQHGYVYIANIEHGPNGDSNDTKLRTVLRQGIQLDDKSWEWTATLIEDRTVHDAWHTAPGIAVDREGFVHVAYNMHNTPWQYKRSLAAHDISEFAFHGQFISQQELDRWKFENKSYFPTFGNAEIHGNQISYPRFAKNNSGELYITYRFAAKPNQTFANRMMSSGLAKFDYQTKTWNSIGVPLTAESNDYVADPNAPQNATIIAGQSGWTSYLPRLMFGPDDELHLSLYWRQGIAGANTTRPCHFYTRDDITFSDISGADLVLPITSDDCSNIGYSTSNEFYSVGNSAMDSEQTPYILTSPINALREIVHYDYASNSWVKEPSPDNAVEIFFDNEDNMWALGTGLKVLRRNKNETKWNTVYHSGNSNDCYPRASLNEDKSIAYIHTHSCDSKSVSVYAIRLQ